MYGSESDANRMGLPHLNKRLRSPLFDPQDRPLCPHNLWQGSFGDPPSRHIVVMEVKGYGVLVLTQPDADAEALNVSLYTNEEIRPIAKEPSSNG
jgi:hypothetical protein